MGCYKLFAVRNGADIATITRLAADTLRDAEREAAGLLAADVDAHRLHDAGGVYATITNSIGEAQTQLRRKGYKLQWVEVPRA